MIPSTESSTNRTVFRKLFWFGVLSTVIAWLAYGVGGFWRNGFPFERNGFVVGRDFLNFWMMGRAAWEPNAARFYDAATYLHALRPLLGNDRYTQQWSYPPTLLLLVAPFGLLNYVAAYAFWLTISVSLLVSAVWCRLRDAWAIWLLFLSPAAIVCFLSGQAAMLSTALIFSAFHWRERRPIIAGMLIGLLSLKPQLGILFPVLLIAERRFRCFAAAALTTLGLALGIALIQGSDIWWQYVSVGMPTQAKVLTISDPRNLASLMTSVYSDFRLLGLSSQSAFEGQAIAALVCAICVYRYFRQPTEAHAGFLFYAAASALSTPYILLYDLLPLTLAIILVLRTRPLRSRDEIVVMAGFLFPIIRYATCWIPLIGPSLIPGLLMAWAWKRFPAYSGRMSEENAVNAAEDGASTQISEPAL